MTGNGQERTPEQRAALAALRRAAARHGRSLEARNQAIAEARAADLSLREIADAAGVSHPTVLKVLREMGGARW